MNFKLVFLTLFSYFFIVSSVSGQSLKSYQKAAEKAMAEKDYNAALLYINKALIIEPNSTNLQFQYAEIARNFNAFELAEEYYLKVLESEEKQNFAAAHFSLGMVYKSLGKYKKAIDEFNKFLIIKSLNKDKLSREKAKKEIKTCQWANKMEESDLVKITQLPKRINTAYSEFSPYLTNDTLYYSSYKFQNKQDNHSPQRRITKVLTSKNNAKGRTLTRGFNVEGKHTAHTAFNTKKDRLYFTICDYKGSAEIKCKIYYRIKDKRGRWKKTPIELPAMINLTEYTATQPNIAYDSLLQKEILYFVSDRPGGKGKMDIWESVINGKKFEKPENVEAINTSEDDLTPFFHKSSQWLYFSSNGHQNLGGYDVFKTKKDKRQTWQEVEHLGKPINTSYNDLYFWLNEEGKLAYLASNRPDSYYLDQTNKSCCNDLYKIDFLDPTPPKTDEPIVEIPPVIPESKPKPELPKTPTTLQDFLPLALYFDNDEPDRRTRKTTTKKTYSQSYNSYIQRKSEYLREYSLPLSEDEQLDAEIKMADFFTTEVQKGHEHLFLFSDILLKRLQNGEKVEIFIKGFTSPRAQSDYNVNLGKRRVSSLRNHFVQYSNAVFQKYLSNGQLRITERSFGETTASSYVSDDLEDQRNSIYSIGAARERRVEIVEITIGGK